MDFKKYPERYWHCSITTKEKGAKPNVINDATLEYLRKEIIEPWQQKRPFRIAGTIINNPADIKQIRIVQTEESQGYYSTLFNNELNKKGMVDMVTDRRLLPFKEGKDYTNEFPLKVISREEKKEPPPNTDKVIPNKVILDKVISDKVIPDKVIPDKAIPGKVISDKVFIVHGHDNQVKETTVSLVEKLGLEAIILHEKNNSESTIIEKFEKYADVSFVIVLLTPDDFGGSNQLSDAVNNNARKDVIFELGFLIGKYGRQRVCALLKDKIEYLSDYSGVLHIPLDGAGNWQLQLAKEMKQAGLPVDLNKAI